MAMDTFTLNSGYKMPRLGLGTWMLDDQDKMSTALGCALDNGYKMVDAALVYQNEPFIGNILKQKFEEGKIRRDDIFIETKIEMVDASEMHAGVQRRLKRSLADLQLEYFDSYLIHFPVNIPYDENDKELMGADHLENRKSDIIGMWKELELLVDTGRVRSLGVSNFNIDQMERIRAVARYPICINQVELHVYLQQPELLDYCKKHGIIVVSYGPLGSAGSPNWPEFTDTQGSSLPRLLDDPCIAELARKYNKSQGQILLRCLLQLGDVAVIPKSEKPERVRQNIDIFDFVISEDDMKLVRALDKALRYFYLAGFRHMEEFPF